MIPAPENLSLVEVETAVPFATLETALFVEDSDRLLPVKHLLDEWVATDLLEQANEMLR